MPTSNIYIFILLIALIIMCFCLPSESQRSHLTSFTMKLKDKFHSPKIRRTPSNKKCKPPPEQPVKSPEKTVTKVVDDVSLKTWVILRQISTLLSLDVLKTLVLVTFFWPHLESKSIRGAWERSGQCFAVLQNNYRQDGGGQEGLGNASWFC